MRRFTKSSNIQGRLRYRYVLYQIQNGCCCYWLMRGYCWWHVRTWPWMNLILKALYIGCIIQFRHKYQKQCSSRRLIVWRMDSSCSWSDRMFPWRWKENRNIQQMVRLQSKDDMTYLSATGSPIKLVGFAEQEPFL